MYNIMTVKLGTPGAIAYGNSNLMVSGTFRGEDLYTFRATLEEDMELSRAKTVLVDRHIRPRAQRLQRQYEALAAVCEERGIPLLEVNNVTYRSPFGGWGGQVALVFEKMQKFGARTFAEADAMALHRFGMLNFGNGSAMFNEP